MVFDSKMNENEMFDYTAIAMKITALNGCVPSPIHRKRNGADVDGDVYCKLTPNHERQPYTEQTRQFSKCDSYKKASLVKKTIRYSM